MNTQKYFLIQVTEMLDSESPTVKALFEYESRDEALSAFYSVLASATVNADVKSCLCEIMNKFGDIDHREYWECQGV